MPTPFQVPVDLFTEKLAKYLRENVGEVSPANMVSGGQDRFAS